ncbi:MAG: TatD family hydrolase [Bacteroidales bacterium]|nr:TatD family hydrolase [Bacteroidales bacterium]
MKYFNFHTHKTDEDFGIVNISVNSLLPDCKFLSAGIHPWDYSKNYSSELDKLKSLASDKTIVAIGETGFDTKSVFDINSQIEVFKSHIEISETHHLPLLIHCVKYFNELIRLRKEFAPKQAWIVHGFNSKIGILSQLIDCGIKISVNSSLFKNYNKVEQVLHIAGIENLFIETDDADEDILSNYNFVAKIYGVSTDELNRNILNNLKNIGINVE